MSDAQLEQEVGDEMDLLVRELLDENGEPPGAAEALLAICVAAQEDQEFNATAVSQILASLGMTSFWDEAKEFLDAPDELPDPDPEPDDEAADEAGTTEG